MSLIFLYPFINIICRTIVVYTFIVFGILFFGKKEISQLSITDLVFILLISNSVQNAMVGPSNSLSGGITSALTLFILNKIFKILNFKYKWFSKFIEGEPIMIIWNGKIIEKNLNREKITEKELLSSVREHGIESIKDVKVAFLEIDGNISIINKENTKIIKHRKKSLPKLNRNE